ncbi:MAG TPA: hypothetical protein VF081_14375 [Solirubrobacterales bacterium]
MDNLAVYCADIGSIAKGNFGWARLEPSVGLMECGRDIDEMVEHIAKDLHTERPVAMGFECPLWVPVPEASSELGMGRPNEGSPSWSSQTGGCVLATGLAQVSWILREVKVRASDVRGFVEWPGFMAAVGCRVFLWEAFVSGAAKADREANDSHTRDAETGARRFAEFINDPVGNCQEFEPTTPFLSLAGAMMIGAGWIGDASLLQTVPLVVRAVGAEDPIAN